MANPLQFMPGLNLLQDPERAAGMAGDMADFIENVGTLGGLRGSDIMPDSSMARRIAALRALASKNPELAQKIMARQGASASAATPVRDYTEDMWPAVSRTPAQPTTKPPLGPVAGVMRGSQNSGMDSAYQAWLASMMSGAGAEQAVSRQNAEAALAELAARKTGGMEEAHRALLAQNKRAPVDPLRASNEGGSAPVFRALAEIGPALLGSGNIQKGLADFGTAAGRNWTAEEARTAEERKQNIAEGVAGLGFREKDMAAMNAAAKERLAIQQAQNLANLIPVRAATTGAEKGLDVAGKKAQLANELDKVRLIKTLDGTPLNTVEGIRALGKEVGGIQQALAMMHPRTDKKQDVGDMVKLNEAFAASGLPSSEKERYTQFVLGNGSPAALTDYGRRIDAYQKTKNAKVFD